MTPDDTDETDELRSLRAAKIGDILDPDQFPLTTEDLIDQYGDVEVSFPSGSQTLRDVLETSGFETYTTRDEAQLAILNGVRRRAVGRARYSDRGYTSDQPVRDWTRRQDSF